MDDGAYVVYSDVTRPGYLAQPRLGASLPLRRSLRPLVAWLHQRRRALPLGAVGVYLDLPNSFHQTWFHEQWPSNNMLARSPQDLGRLLAAAGLDGAANASLALGGWHLQASWSVWRKSDATVALLTEWLRLLASAETSGTAIADQTWLSLLAVKHRLPALSARALGLSAVARVGGEHGHVDPNRAKDLNSALDAEAACLLQWTAPNEPHPEELPRRGAHPC